MSRIDEAIPWDDCPDAKSNANTFVRARAYRVFRPCVLGSTSGAPLKAYGTLGVPPRLIPPHSVQKPYTNSPPSSIVTIQEDDDARQISLRQVLIFSSQSAACIREDATFSSVFYINSILYQSDEGRTDGFALPWPNFSGLMVIDRPFPLERAQTPHCRLRGEIKSKPNTQSATLLRLQTISLTCIPHSEIALFRRLTTSMQHNT